MGFVFDNSFNLKTTSIGKNMYLKRACFQLHELQYTCLSNIPFQGSFSLSFLFYNVWKGQIKAVKILIFNNFNPKIQSTIEEEETGVIHFLDSVLIRESKTSNNRLVTQTNVLKI